MASRAFKIDPKGTKSSVATHTGSTQEPVQSLNTEEIAVRSYELWQERGCPFGSPEVDWLRAEQELRDRRPPGA